MLVIGKHIKIIDAIIIFNEFCNRKLDVPVEHFYVIRCQLQRSAWKRYLVSTCCLGWNFHYGEWKVKPLRSSSLHDTRRRQGYFVFYSLQLYPPLEITKTSCRFPVSSDPLNKDILKQSSWICASKRKTISFLSLVLLHLGNSRGKLPPILIAFIVQVSIQFQYFIS